MDPVLDQALARLKLLVQTCTYKPGFTINLQRGARRESEWTSSFIGEGYFRLWLEGYTADVRPPHDEVRIVFNQVLSDNLLLAIPPEQVLRKFVAEWEIHEADEWLRLDGVPLADPHADDYIPPTLTVYGRP